MTRLRGRSKLPDSVTFKLARPSGFDDLSDEDLRAAVIRSVTELENDAEAECVVSRTNMETEPNLA